MKAIRYASGVDGNHEDALVGVIQIDKIHIQWWYKQQMQSQSNDIMMMSWNGNIFCITGPLCGELIGHRWIPRTKASEAKLWCFFDLRLE